MNAPMPRIGVLAACLIAGMIAAGWHAETNAVASKNPATTASHLDKPAAKAITSWDHKSAAAYLDQRASWWMDWPKAARDHETFCV
jgi:hypothetical protein